MWPNFNSPIWMLVENVSGIKYCKTKKFYVGNESYFATNMQFIKKLP